jgi:uncharacterized membrane protein
VHTKSPPRALLSVVQLVACLGSAGCSTVTVTDAAIAPDSAGPIGTSGAVCPPGSTLRYETFGAAFFSAHCTRCHASTNVGAVARRGAPVGLDWDELSVVRAHADAIDRMAAGGPLMINRTMPPTEPRPSDADRLMLGEWLACGAP